MRMKGEPGRKKGNCYHVDRDIFKRGQRWVGGRDACGGDQAGEVVGVVVSGSLEFVNYY